jgi:hypothetical protein
MKLEPSNLDQLEHEFGVYRTLTGGPGIPAVYWFGMECDANAMALELLGPSLESLFKSSNYALRLKTVLLLADQMVRNSISC